MCWVDAQVSVNTAPKLPRFTSVATSSAVAGEVGNGCWTLQGAGQKPFTPVEYTGEKMSVAADGHGRELLIGTASGYREVDTVNTPSDLISASTIMGTTKYGRVTNHFTFAYFGRAFAVPDTSNRCTLK